MNQVSVWPMPGDVVFVFDTRLYRNDKKTPPSHTIRRAVVLRRYGKRSEHFGWTDGDLIDVRFDHDGRESRGHFTDAIA